MAQRLEDDPDDQTGQDAQGDHDIAEEGLRGVGNGQQERAEEDDGRVSVSETGDQAQASASAGREGLQRFGKTSADPPALPEGEEDGDGNAPSVKETRPEGP